MGATWEKTQDPGIYKRDGARGRHYRVAYRDATGHQVVRNFDRLEEARDHKRRNTGNDRPHDARAGRRTLRELYERQTRARDYAEETGIVRRAAWTYIERWADTPVEKVTPTLVDEIRATVPKPAMRTKVNALLSVLFEYAIEQRWVRTSPVSRPRKRRTRAERLSELPNEDRKRYLTNDELARLLDAMPERYRALIELMARMGLRPGEAYALRVAKFDPLRRTLVIDTSVSGFTKTGEARTLHLPIPIADTLREHVERYSDPKDPEALIFTRKDGAPIEPDNFRRRIFASAVHRAEIDATLSPNTCRHTAAAFAISTGANIYDVQKMLGHARPSITLDVYGSLFEEQHERFIDAYGRAIEEARMARRAGRVVPFTASS